MYLFYGLDEFLINKEISKIISNCDNINISRYDLEEDTIKNILTDASTISLFEDKKIVIVKNSYIFTGVNSKKQIEQNIKILEDYILNKNELTTIIFIVIKDKLDSRKKIVSLFKEHGIVKEFNKPVNLNSFITNLFNPYKIDYSLCNLLIDRVGNNSYLLSNEIEKIKIYKDQDLKITKEDIVKLTSKNIDIDIFNLIDNVINGNKETAIECYHEMLKYGEEPISIIIMLANQIRIMYQSKILIKKGYSEKNIADKLEIHEYRVKKGLEKARLYNESKLLDYLEKLAIMDIDLKKGNMDKNIGLELFILNI